MKTLIEHVKTVLQSIRRRVSTGPGPVDPVSMFVPVPKERPYMDALTLQSAITHFKEAIHDLRQAMGTKWKTDLAKPVVQAAFPGCGFLCSKGFRVNKRITVYEHDDCMDFTSVLVAVDGTPTLVLKVKRGLFTVYLIRKDADYVAEIIRPIGVFKLEAGDDFYALPDPIRRVVHDVLECVYQTYLDKLDPTEVLLNYNRA